MASPYSYNFTFAYPAEHGYPGLGASAPFSPLPRGGRGQSMDGASTTALDMDYLKKVEHHERTLQEIQKQWQSPIPWSNSIGISPQVIFGLAPQESASDCVDHVHDHEHKDEKEENSESDESSGSDADDENDSDYEDRENRPPKRVKTRASASDDDDATFLPMEHPIAPPARVSSPRKSSPKKQNNKRPRPIAPPPRASKPSGASEQLVEGGNNVRCLYDDCNTVIERRFWQEHMDDVHQLRAQEKFVCLWDDCGSAAQTHPIMVRHLKCSHFIGRVHECARCGTDFNRRDALKRHARTCGRRR